MSKRSKRQQQFLNRYTGWYGTLSANLLDSAYTLLVSALHERRDRVLRVQDNHYSRHAIGSIALLVAGLEAWLNVSIWKLSTTPSWWGMRAEDILKLADQPIKKKYYEVPKRIKGAEMQPQSDLEMVLDVRHEIEHFLPRIVQEEGTITRHIPSWLDKLYQRRLLMLPPESAIKAAEREGSYIDMPLSQLMSSYHLSYWAWESVTGAATTFVNVLGEERIDPLDNFKRYQRVCPPSKLSEYDESHGLAPS